MPAIPQQGDTIVLMRKDATGDRAGTESFVVRRATWNFRDYGGEKATAKFTEVWVEAEMAYGPINSGEFVETLKRYEKNGYKVKVG